MSAQLTQVLEAIDAANTQDPTLEDGQPAALLYGQRMSEEQARLFPDASDALQIAAEGVNALRGDDRSFIVVTHYQRLLNYIVPDCVHVLAGGKIVKSGGRELALELEEKGYSWIQ